MRRQARSGPVSPAASAGQPVEAGGSRRGTKAGTNVFSPSGLRRLLKRWRNDPLLLYGLPSVLVLLLVLYLCLAPEPSQSTTASAPRAPAVVLTSADSRTCSPLSVEDDAELHMRLLRCGGRVIGGEYLSATVSIFVRDYLLAAAALADTLSASPESSSSSSPPLFLLLGTSTGQVASILQNRLHLKGDVLCDDPELLTQCASYFGFTPSRHVLVSALPAFIAELQHDEAAGGCSQTEYSAQYDLVLVDAQDGRSGPDSFSVYSLPSLRALSCAMTARGVLAVSLIISRHREDLLLPHSLYLTLSSLFPHVLTYHDGAAAAETATVVLFASQLPFSLQLTELLKGRRPGWEQEDADDEMDERYAVGVWRQMLSKWSWSWDAAHAVDEQGTAAYQPVLLTAAVLQQQMIGLQQRVVQMQHRDTLSMFNTA